MTISGTSARRGTSLQIDDIDTLCATHTHCGFSLVGDSGKSWHLAIRGFCDKRQIGGEY